MYFDEIEYDHEMPLCHMCEEFEGTLDQIKDHMGYVLNELYSKDALNMRKLEDSIEEICHYLGINMPIEFPNIERTRESKTPIFEFATELARLQAQNLG